MLKTHLKRNISNHFTTEYQQKDIRYQHRYQQKALTGTAARTAQCAMLVNLCYVSRGTEVRKVSNSKSDLRGHSRVL